MAEPSNTLNWRRPNRVSPCPINGVLCSESVFETCYATGRYCLNCMVLRSRLIVYIYVGGIDNHVLTCYYLILYILDIFGNVLI